MKKLLVLAVLAAGLGGAFAASVSAPAFAGGCGGCSGGCVCKSDDGFECSNQCPLAQEANKHRSSGREALGSSPACRATHCAAVQRNLSRV